MNSLYSTGRGTQSNEGITFRKEDKVFKMSCKLYEVISKGQRQKSLYYLLDGKIWGPRGKVCRICSLQLVTQPMWTRGAISFDRGLHLIDI